MLIGYVDSNIKQEKSKKRFLFDVRKIIDKR